MEKFRNKDDESKILLVDEIQILKNKNDIKNKEYLHQAYGYSFYSCITPYGLEKIKKRLHERIDCMDRPVTLLWHHNGYSSYDNAPDFQLNGSKPINGQKGGINRDCSKKPEYWQWVSYGKVRTRIDGKKTKIDLPQGELLENASYSGYDGYWDVLPHYRKECEDMNSYIGDVKTAIITSPLSDKDKQDLLDSLYLSQCPMRYYDNKFSLHVLRYREEVYELDLNCNLKKEELFLKGNKLINDLKKPEVPKQISDNLISNLEHLIKRCS